MDCSASNFANCFYGALRYIYTGNMSLSSLKEDLILDILGLAHLYGFQELETSISEYLKAVLSVRTVCLIYDTASLYQVTTLFYKDGGNNDLHDFSLAGLSLHGGTCFHGPPCCRGEAIINYASFFIAFFLKSWLSIIHDGVSGLES